MELDKFLSKHSGRFFRKREINPYEIWENEDGKYVKMFAKDKYFIFDYDDLEKVKGITWGLHKNSKVLNPDREVYYVITKINNKTRYLHQHIMNYFGHGSKGLTIDHINQNPLDNRKKNLRLLTKSEQLKNTGKRLRKRSASKLPEELKDITIPKYIYYIKQLEPRIEKGYCEKFVIQSHPSLHPDKQLTSSSSSKFTLLEKLEQAKEKLKQLDLQATHSNCSGKPLES